MGKKLMIFAGVLTLLQATVQAVFSSLSLAQYFNLIDFLRELPNLLYIKILYFHNPIRYGPRINIGQVIDGIADQAFVLQINEPFTVTRTFSINCVSLALSVLWIIASSILLAGGARNEYSRPIRWPWIAVTVSICAVDLVATVTFANDSFHTRTLNNIMDYIGGTVSGIGSAQLNTSAAAWIMVSMYSRFVIFFVLNATVIVLIALNKNISSKADAVTVESPVMTPPIIPPAPIMPAPPPAVEIISPMAQLIDVTIDDDEERTRAPEVNVPAAVHTSTKVKTTSEPRTIIPLPPPVPLSNITEASSNVSSTRDIDEVTLREEEITSMSNVLKNDKETVSSPKIPRAGFSQAFRNMKKFLFTKESPRRDSVVESVEVSPERSPELDRFLVRLVSNVNRVTGQDSASSVRNTHLNRQQGRPSLPIGWLVLSAILSRSPRIQHANDDKKRAVNFPDNLLSLPQRLENLIAEQQRRLDRAIINTSGRTSPPRTSQSLPHLNGNSEETNPAFNKGRRGTAAELQGQLPWAYIPASAHRMRDQLPPDEDLPPVPLPDYTAIPSFRKASVHRAASSLSSLTHKKLYTNQLPRNKSPLTQTDVLY